MANINGAPTAEELAEAERNADQPQPYTPPKATGVTRKAPKQAPAARTLAQSVHLRVPGGDIVVYEAGDVVEDPDHAALIGDHAYELPRTV